VKDIYHLTPCHYTGYSDFENMWKKITVVCFNYQLWCNETEEVQGTLTFLFILSSLQLSFI
jgi:hypothetical protein